MGYFADRMNEIHWGFFVLSKLQWIINTTILLKLFDAPVWLYVVTPIVIVLALIIVGKIFNKKLRKGFINKYYEGADISIKK